jgi:hypothetical protein
MITKIINEKPRSAIIINSKKIGSYCDEISSSIKHDLDGGSRKRKKIRTRKSKKKTQRRRNGGNYKRTKRAKRS